MQDINKSPGFDGIRFTVFKSCFGVLYKSLLRVFNLSIVKGIFPDDLKISRVTPVLKGVDEKDLGNYRPLSVLPYFSKILEKIMYNRLYNHFINNNILYSKQFGFRKGHSTDHAQIQLIDQINNDFENNGLVFDVFIDLSKAFYTVFHQILLKKLIYYGVNGNNIRWFKSYLANRKQFLSVNNKNENFANITCEVPQGSILGLLLFVIYVNDLRSTSNILEAIMFDDDTNLFFSHRNISTLFLTIMSYIKLENSLRQTSGR